MDEIERYEIFDLLRLIPWSKKDSYEQMRLLMWATLKTTYKVDKPEKMLPLITDKEDNVEKFDTNNIELVNATRKAISQAFDNLNKNKK